MSVLPLGAQKSFDTCELPSQHARGVSDGRRGHGGRPCMARSPLSEAVPPAPSARPRPGTRFKGLSVARDSCEGVGTGTHAATATGSGEAAPPEEEEGRLGVEAAPFPAPGLPRLALPSRAASPPRASGGGHRMFFRSRSPRPPPRPRSHFPFAPLPQPAALGAGT